MGHNTGSGWCYGGAEVKGPQFVAGQTGPLGIKDPEGRGSYGDWGIGIPVVKDRRYQLIELDPVEDVSPMKGVNPFRTLITLEMAKVIDDAVKAEVTRQMQEWAPDERAIEAAITRLISERTIQLTPRPPR
jgi:hypothetical protein